MNKWIAKAALQKCISFLPYKHKINYFFQKHVTKGVILTDDLFETKLLHCNQHISEYRKFNNKLSGFATLELGTGWHPIVPIGMYLNNASYIYSADIKLLVTDKSMRETIKKFIQYHNSSKLIQILPTYNIQKIKILQKIIDLNYDLDRTLREVNMKIIIGNIYKSEHITLNQIDLIHSNNTLEHIQVDQLKKILIFFRKVISIDGIMSHFIDLSDHFSHMDKNVTPFNFLKFSDNVWHLIDNNIQPQNRLRISEYRKLIEETKWKILDEQVIRGAKKDLENIKISNKFKAEPVENLLVTHALIISKPA